jgi:hypothetical protein
MLRPTYVGVALEEPSPRILAAVASDLIGLTGALLPRERLVVLSPNHMDLNSRFSTSFPYVVFDGSELDRASIWKAYYVKDLPSQPIGGTFTYKCFLGSQNKTGGVVLKPPLKEPVSLIPPEEVRFVPPGSSPMSKPSPARIVDPYRLIPWS